MQLVFGGYRNNLDETYRPHISYLMLLQYISINNPAFLSLVTLELPNYSFTLHLTLNTGLNYMQKLYHSQKKNF